MLPSNPVETRGDLYIGMSRAKSLLYVLVRDSAMKLINEFAEKAGK